MTLARTLREVFKNPGELLLRRWNWKAAILASLLRAAIFFFSNISAGWHAARSALLVEFAYRAATSGFWGALTQVFREVEPAWVGATVALLVIPLLSHALELAVHLLQGTPRIWGSMLSSVIFTALSTLFNLYAMRHGALTVGPGAGSFAQDLKRLPRLMAGFVAAGPMFVLNRLRRPPADALY